MRLFAAVWPPAGILSWLEGLPRPAVPGLRWTTGDQWHVTLAFYGEVPEEELPPLADALGTAAAAVRELPVAALGDRTLQLGRGVLCVPASGLESLAAGVRDATSRWVGDGSPFTGHLTLARARRGRAVPPSLVGAPLPYAVATGDASGTGAPASSWAVEEVCLVVSTREPSGSRYRTAASTGIGGGRPADPGTPPEHPGTNMRSQVQCGDRWGREPVREPPG